MMIHGTGGGFDQGLLFASALRQHGFHQADVLVELLDHIGLDRIPVIGGSAGALTAAAFALRHPDRCSHLVLLVPAANLTARDPVEFSALQRMAVAVVLESDWWFWALSRLAPGQMIRTLLATDPALLDQVTPEERQRAEVILTQIFPISRKVDGLRRQQRASKTRDRASQMSCGRLDWERRQPSRNSRIADDTDLDGVVGSNSRRF